MKLSDIKSMILKNKLKINFRSTKNTPTYLHIHPHALHNIPTHLIINLTFHPTNPTNLPLMNRIANRNNLLETGFKTGFQKKRVSLRLFPVIFLDIKHL